MKISSTKATRITFCLLYSVAACCVPVLMMSKIYADHIVENTKQNTSLAKTNLLDRPV
jgi:hypothetical protein